MATEAMRQQVVPVIRVKNPKSDRVFFAAMIVVLWAEVLYGFARTYFLAGMLSAPLPNKLIHIHGAIMTLWMVVLFIQTALISAHRVKWHMKFGWFGFGLALSMIIIGPIAATDALRRGAAPLGLDALTFYIIPLSAIFVFGVLAFLAYAMRRKAADHKRLILIATLALMDAAVGRWPVAFLQHNPKAQDLVPLAFLLAMMAYDFATQRKVLKTTLFASIFLMLVHMVRVPIGFTAPWHHFAAMMARG